MARAGAGRFPGHADPVDVWAGTASAAGATVWSGRRSMWANRPLARRRTISVDTAAAVPFHNHPVAVWATTKTDTGVTNNSTSVVAADPR